MPGFAGVTEEFEKHPAWIAIAVVAVAIIALMQRRNSTPSDTQYTFAGGGAAAPIDPSVAAIEQARISAGSQNIGIVAGLLGLENTNATALTGSLAQTSAAKDVELARTAAAEEVANAETSAQLYAAQGATAEQLTAAQITAGVQRALIDSQSATDAAAIQAQENVANFQTQAQKDIARAGDNTSIVQGVINVGEDLLKWAGF